MSTVCAIVPTFNRSQMLAECLDSLLSQSRRPDQIIVINDGSTDDTEAVLAGYGDQISSVTLSNGGKARALNHGLELCTSDYVWICDDDDIAAPGACARLVEALDAAPEAGFAYGRYLRFLGDCVPSNHKEMSYWPDDSQSNLPIALMERLFTCQFAMLVRKSAYDEVGPFRVDLLRSQDYDMILRLARATPAVYIPHVLFYQRIHPGVRGPVQDRFNAAAAAERWLSYDQKIFSVLRDSLAPAELVPPFAADSGADEQRRAALLQGFCIFARKAMWDPALSDLREACQLGRDQRATREERNLVSRALAESLICDKLSQEPEVVKALQTCAASGPYGRDLVTAIGRPLPSKIRIAVRSGEFDAAWRYLKMMSRIQGLLSSLQRIVFVGARRAHRIITAQPADKIETI